MTARAILPREAQSGTATGVRRDRFGFRPRIARTRIRQRAIGQKPNSAEMR